MKMADKSTNNESAPEKLKNEIMTFRSRLYIENQNFMMKILNNPVKTFLFIAMLTSSTWLTSCQKVINLDLNSAAPQLVVEANISDTPGPYYVKLSKTVNFNNINSIPPVSGATVEITDSSGNGETLTELSAGIYRTDKLQGVPGQLYRLTIHSEGQLYESEARMPYPVDNFSVQVIREEADDHSAGGNAADPQPGYQVNFEIQDPAEYKNYYRFIVYYKNFQMSSRRVIDDQYHNGKIIADEFGLHDTINFEPGAAMVVELQNIDAGAYNFFRTLRDGIAGMSFLSASPSNPISNISNNALGYFSAYSVNLGYATIPK
jgi:Domain of unknown function (DUF4249)